MPVRCDPQLLSAYLDGELSSELTAQVEQHVSRCAQCTAELRQLAESSQLLRQHSIDEPNPQEMDRLHQAIRDVAAERSVWRLGMVLGALAASILVVCSVWLMELPAPSARPVQMVRVPAPRWERIAVTLRADPIVVDDNSSIQLANADFTDWMLQGLAGK
jgi:anti-sigma factor RsiW